MMLEQREVEAAAAELSGEAGYFFTRRNLMFELVRREAWPDPGNDLRGCEQRFAAALVEHETKHGPLARLVRPEQAPAGLDTAELDRFDLPGDLFDYAIHRVALFERMDLCLMLIANGFHREIEIALTVPPAFPTHVWSRIQAQLDAGQRTTFFAIHDCGPASDAWLTEVDQRFAGNAAAVVHHVGMTVPWAFRLRLPLRGSADPVDNSQGSDSYAVLEELTPLRVMRSIYGRVARGAEDVGFG